jgi:hypothetical protein
MGLPSYVLGEKTITLSGEDAEPKGETRFKPGTPQGFYCSPSNVPISFSNELK